MTFGSLAIDHIGVVIPSDDLGERRGTELEDGVALFVRAEELGYDSAWVRRPKTGLPSASPFLAAATQRTRRIGLGVAVMQMGSENPLRLAEDLAAVDALGNGRLHVGLSAGGAGMDLGYGWMTQLAADLDGYRTGEGEAAIASAGGRQWRLRPHAQGLRDRLWYDAASVRSAAWAAASGFNLLTGNAVAENAGAFQAAQLAHIEAYWNGYAGGASPRVSAGRVILPIDGADARTRHRYEEFAASRLERTFSPDGERRARFAPAIVGTAEQILEALSRDPVLRHVSELRLELPYDFAREDHEQILSDFIRLVAPEIGHRRH
ncbi:LLM class flavin-dependent oxidoreductase [Bosea caraganae]|uniref:LLM class flavin-dependent oxidoreductase n=1 Tax=Bosea caraganae TaxID=2763117 RepID=A0A370L2F8_9HYPH|nr:LLM class flavin-dependent oxidoreductase [Bosea caraganae]RDJ22408.1 LLM class flavin-dependent oxidoreductase [Bosea caraganae]RDJ30367.1 LLM class flavin-dependent oxidoreductase [Bosea caraganae]